MKQLEIVKRQNEDFSLKCQFVAKCHFNKAENANYLVWLFCILSALTIFIPESNKWFIILLPLFLDIIGFVLEHIVQHSVATAALLRNYFDAYVLDINTSQFIDSDIRKIKSIVEKTVTKRVDECAIQISHTGKDNPPGVFDWYEFSHDFSDTEVQFECQRQNCWWNKELSKRRILSLFIVTLVILLLIIIAGHYMHTNDNLLRILLCSGIVLKIFEQSYAHWTCHKLFLKIEGACEMLEHCKSQENILTLQAMIESRRKIPILEINAIHKRIAAKLSNHYKKIS